MRTGQPASFLSSPSLPARRPCRKHPPPATSASGTPAPAPWPWRGQLSATANREVAAGAAPEPDRRGRRLHPSAVGEAGVDARGQPIGHLGALPGQHGHDRADPAIDRRAILGKLADQERREVGAVVPGLVEAVAAHRQFAVNDKLICRLGEGQKRHRTAEGIEGPADLGGGAQDQAESGMRMSWPSRGRIIGSSGGGGRVSPVRHRCSGSGGVSGTSSSAGAVLHTMSDRSGGGWPG